MSRLSVFIKIFVRDTTLIMSLKFYYPNITRTQGKNKKVKERKMTDLPPLNTDTLWAILNETIDDVTVNKLVWHYLGYRYNETQKKWDISEVIPEWQNEYPEPPDFFDSRPAAMKLTRSIPQENKQSLKEKLGFKGYKIGEFGPRQTRRATAANWLLSYMQIHGIKYQ
jgi:Domain of unknown function (DUF1823)